MKMLNPLLAICLMASAAAAQDLSWTELASRPELWPAQCTVKDTIKFEGGMSVPAGARVDVLDFKGNEADMKTTAGKTYFAAEPEDTDVLDVARAAYTKLTPKQRALTYPLIVQQKDLWPYQSHHHPELRSGSGKDRAGRRSGARERCPARQG